jgi:phosphatidylglycerol---prolipoprotein diacylglyceryl transferase
MAAFLAGLWLAGRHLARRGVSPSVFERVSFWTIVGGLIGARLYYVVQSDLGWYLAHPQHILAAWEGGMAYFGAVLAALAVLAFFARRERLDYWLLADGAALFAAIGQPIGRIGNIFNGDILGYPSNLPWAIRYTDPHTFAPSRDIAYQPANVYELLVALAILGIILVLRSRARLRPGGLILSYLWLYAGTQFLVFFLRSNPPVLLGLKQAQWTSLVLLALLLPVTLWWRSRNRPREHEGGGGGEAADQRGLEGGTEPRRPAHGTLH